MKQTFIWRIGKRSTLITAISVICALGAAAAPATPRADSSDICQRTAETEGNLPMSPLADFLCQSGSTGIPAPIDRLLPSSLPGKSSSNPIPMAPQDTSDLLPICITVHATDNRCETWATSYDNPSGHEFDGPVRSITADTVQLDVVTSGYAGADRLMAFEVAPSGDRIFVTGISFDSVTGYDSVTASYDATTGEQLWLSRYDGPGAKSLVDAGIAITVSADGSRVYVAGYHDLETQSSLPQTGEFLTIAYDTTTGEQLWVATLDPSLKNDAATAIALSPDGEQLFVAGILDARASALVADIGTVAYSTQSGELLWSAAYDAGAGDFPIAVNVTPDGGKVLIGGTSYYKFNPPSNSYTLEYLAIAYSASGDNAGAQLWINKYHEVNNQGLGLTAQATAVAFGPDAIYLTGITDNPVTAVFDAVGATVAVAASTGETRWIKKSLVGAATTLHGAATSIAGDRVYLTGLVTNSQAFPSVDYDFGTWALDAVTGAQVWFSRYVGIRDDWAWGTSVIAPRDGNHVIVAGISVTFVPPQIGLPARGDYATIAYNASTGSQVWAARYNGSPALTDLEADTRVAVRATPNGLKVFTAGTLIRQPPGINYSDFGLWAYDAT